MKLIITGSEKELVKFVKMNRTYVSRKGLAVEMAEDKKAEPKKEVKPKEAKPKVQKQKKKAEPKKEVK